MGVPDLMLNTMAHGDKLRVSLALWHRTLQIRRTFKPLYYATHNLRYCLCCNELTPVQHLVKVEARDACT